MLSFYNRVKEIRERLIKMNERYSRQILFDKIGEQGQEKIEKSNVTIVGMGALGTHVAEQFARSGVNRLNIIDRDYVESSNLQRQTLFVEKDIKEMLPKVVAAERHLKKIREDIQIKAYIAQCDAKLLQEVARYSDIIIDATDNFNTRLIINDFAYKMNIPWIYGACLESTYVQATFIPGVTPCFDCVLPQLPVINRTCDTVGVINPAVTMATSLQVADGLKILSGFEFTPKITYGDVWYGEHQTFGFDQMRRNDCETCGDHPTYSKLSASEQQITELCGRHTVQYINEKLNRPAIEKFIAKNGLLHRSNAYMIQYLYDDHRVVAFNNGRLLIHDIDSVEDGRQFVENMFG